MGDVWRQPRVERGLDNWLGLSSVYTRETPAIRIAISCLHTEAEIDDIVRKIVKGAGPGPTSLHHENNNNNNNNNLNNQKLSCESPVKK